MRTLADVVPQEFKDKVAHEIAQADIRARDKGAKSKPKSKLGRRFTEREIKEFYERYLDGESLRDIAGKDHSRILKLFKTRGYKLRTRSESMRLWHGSKV